MLLTNPKMFNIIENRIQFSHNIILIFYFKLKNE